jgi:hypothetical protein
MAAYINVFTLKLSLQGFNHEEENETNSAHNEGVIFIPK